MHQVKAHAQQAEGVLVGGGAIVQADTAPPPVAAQPNAHVKKVVVAVHGVGDQYSFATLQSVVNQFCGFYGLPAAMPLGSFHNGQAAFSIHPPYPEDPFARLAFSEVYWAKIPRAIVDDKHTMEESKKWASTIVERLRMRWKASGNQAACRDKDFDTMKLILSEMIETLAVLERISFLADRAGLFTFDLRKLLDDYLGDVQVVAEFGSERTKILGAFESVMTNVHTAYPQAELFIVAHSEGTVVSLLGILQAGASNNSPWLDRVRGFMTIGSPIDKHLILWPELFPVNAPVWKRSAGAEKIQWYNYYDRGDPIGFSLDDARSWLAASGWDEVFNFPDAHDFGFDRYPFPGKAHVDYWNDSGVFGHFIENAVNKTIAPLQSQPAQRFAEPPGNIVWKKWLSYCVPYAGVSALLFLGVFILYKVVIAAIHPEIEAGKDDPAYSFSVLVRSVSCTTILLLGITTSTRILRLANDRFWKVFAFVLWISFVAVYLLVIRSGETVHIFTGVANTGLVVQLFPPLAMGVLIWLTTITFPSWGLKPLILLGTTCIAGVVGVNIYLARAIGEIGPIWPVILGTAGFLYLWWLAALTFDLVFVWHLYIRNARSLKRMDTVIGTHWGGGGTKHAPGARAV